MWIMIELKGPFPLRSTRNAWEDYDRVGRSGDREDLAAGPLLKAP